MPQKARYKRPTRAEIAKMTPAERLEHKRAVNREKQRRWKQRQKSVPKAERRARKLEEGARLYTWDRLLPHIVKQDNGCWLWTGGLHASEWGVRPFARAGVYGMESVEHIVCCLHRGRPPPRCTAKRVCETIGCVAPEHIVWSNRVVETAKKRRRHVEKELARVEQ